MNADLSVRSHPRLNIVFRLVCRGFSPSSCRVGRVQTREKKKYLHDALRFDARLTYFFIPAETENSLAIHREAPPFVDQSTEMEMLVTGIKVLPPTPSQSLVACRLHAFSSETNESH